MLDCTEYYKINNAIAGAVLTDAAFITALSGNATRIVWGGQDFGFPRIKCVLGGESLAAGAATRTPGRVVLSGRGGGLNVDEDRWIVPIPFWGVSTTEIAQPGDGIGEPYDANIVNMPWPEGSTLCDGTVSKLYGVAANTYSAFVLYRQFGAKCTAPKGGRVAVVTYDKGGDSTTVVWNTFENAAQNAAGELLKDHNYRLLWIQSTAEAISDKEMNLVRVTVPGFPPLIVPGGGCFFGPPGTSRKIWFLDDSVMMRGDAVHKVEGHIGAACQPLIHIGWEDMGVRQG